MRATSDFSGSEPLRANNGPLAAEWTQEELLPEEVIEFGSKEAGGGNRQVLVVFEVEFVGEGEGFASGLLCGDVQIPAQDAFLAIGLLVFLVAADFDVVGIVERDADLGFLAHGEAVHQADVGGLGAEVFDGEAVGVVDDFIAALGLLDFVEAFAGGVKGGVDAEADGEGLSDGDGGEGAVADELAAEVAGGGSGEEDHGAGVGEFRLVVHVFRQDGNGNLKEIALHGHLVDLDELAVGAAGEAGAALKLIGDDDALVGAGLGVFCRRG